MMLFCVIWVTEYTCTFDDYIDMMILFYFFFSKRKMHEIESFICNNAAHDVILCDLGY